MEEEVEGFFPSRAFLTFSLLRFVSPVFLLRGSLCKTGSLSFEVSLFGRSRDRQEEEKGVEGRG